jgi:RepB DNA-primase from phage plasmid
MGADLFEIGLFKPDAPRGEAIMVPRVWARDALMRSVPWLRYQNRDGRNIYVRPGGEHNLSLVDDLTWDCIRAMKSSGFAPAVVVETSSANFQAWLKHPRVLDKKLGTAVARALAQKFGGDTGAADWRHYGRLSGFVNRKARHLNVTTGLYPFVKIIESRGAVYPAAEDFLGEVVNRIAEQRQAELERRTARERNSQPHLGPLKSIDAFRVDPRYGGDGKRADLAYAVYAFSRGQTEAHVDAAIRSRDLSHKGSERRQEDYVGRTIRKALATSERGHGR